VAQTVMFIGVTSSEVGSAVRTDFRLDSACGVIPRVLSLPDMPNYRRYHVAGATYFFTLKTEHNAPIFRRSTHARLLGNVIREMQDRWPLEIVAMVLLPDHLHTIWTLPTGDANYLARWAWIKKEFTKRYLDRGGAEQSRSKSRIRDRRRGVWQRKYWEHTIQDEKDFDAHFDYIHWNPVKHGYVTKPKDWQHSTFHRWVKDGVYSHNWGTGIVIPDSVLRVTNAGE
jgi:putative transposase